MKLLVRIACLLVFLMASMVGAAAPAENPHAHHQMAMKKASYQVRDALYDVPEVHLLDTSGTSVDLRDILASDEPVALNFIFTTCTTICPVMTVTFAQMEQMLGDEADELRLVSVSIDPEYDRPEILDAYAKQFRAGGNWTFLTGDTDDIVSVLRSFDSYTGSKMSHRPVTLLKRPDSDSWIRIDGLPSGEALAREVSTRLLN